MNVVGRGVDHVGIYVDDLDKTVAFLAEAFGLSTLREVEIPTVLKAVILDWGNVAVELIELTDSGARREKLGGASARLDHVAVRSEDVESDAAQLRTKGVRTTTEAAMKSEEWTHYLLDASTTVGIPFQIIESSVAGR